MYTNIRKFKEGGNYPEQQNGLPQAFFTILNMKN